MTSRERVLCALRFEEFDQVPIDGDDATRAPYTPGRGVREAYRALSPGFLRTDAWGCVWQAAEDGVAGEVKQSPLAGEDRSALAGYQPPWEVIEQADFSQVNRFCAESDRFVMGHWEPHPNPFERLQFLRGTEQLLVDLALDEPELYRLRDLVHAFNMKILERWVATDVDGIQIGDDWGTQTGLLISPARWRAFFKPLYRDYCDLAHAHGKYVYMHSDGHIREILPDLIEIGVNAVNAQLFCMDIEALAEEFRYRICFWGEMDRQYLLTSGTPAEIHAAVQRLVRAFMPTRRTGLVAQWYDGKGHRPENMAAVHDAWRQVNASWRTEK